MHYFKVTWETLMPGADPLRPVSGHETERLRRPAVLGELATRVCTHVAADRREAEAVHAEIPGSRLVLWADGELVEVQP